MAALYLVAGVLFAVFFLSNGIKKVDPTTNGSSLGFRIIILPGIIVLWPVLLHQWMKIKMLSHDKTAA